MRCHLVRQPTWQTSRRCMLCPRQSWQTWTVPEPRRSIAPRKQDTLRWVPATAPSNIVTVAVRQNIFLRRLVHSVW